VIKKKFSKLIHGECFKAVVGTLLLLFALCSCKNDAITFAQSVYPDAICTAIVTTTGFGRSGDYDAATCKAEGIILHCTREKCEKLRDIPPEKQTSISPCPETK